MCFSAAWLQQLLINLIILGAVIAIIKLIVPYALSMFGGGVIIAQVINIILWAIVAIYVVIIVFGLLSCLMGSGGFSLFPHR